MRHLFGSHGVNIISRIVSIQSDAAALAAHSGILHQGAGFFTGKAIGSYPICRRMGMLNSRYIKTYEMTIPDGRFHLVNVFFHFTHTKTIKPKLINHFQHIRMHKITLEANMRIMTKMVGQTGKHIYQKNIFRKYAFHIEINFRINHCCINYAIQIAIGLILSQGIIMSASNNQYFFSGLHQLSHYGFHGCITILQRRTSSNISQIG